MRQELGVTRHLEEGKIDNHAKVTEIVKTETGLHNVDMIDSNRLAEHTPPATPTGAITPGNKA